MPLHTQIIRDGKPLKIRWGNFHIAAMALAASFDAKAGLLGDMTQIYDKELHVHPYMPFPVSRSLVSYLADYRILAITPLNGSSGYTLQRAHEFIDLEDGEVLSLLPDDVLTAYRS